MSHNDVSFEREDYTYHAVDWERERDVLKGERAIKDKKHKYVPMLNPTDTTPENIARNKEYILRAYYFNATGRTLEGLVGIAFSNEPEVVMPESMDAVKTDVDGSGGGLINQAHRSVEEVLAIGRLGLFVDYPKRTNAVSIAEQSQQNIHSTITTYRAEQINNWKIGENRKLSLVVLNEIVEIEDTYQTTNIQQWRELRMLDGVYVVRIWQRTGTDIILVDEYTPTDGTGATWGHIPFYFVGAMDNNPDIDKSPSLDLANANISHYRNSCDYQDSTFFVGQPQIWVSGADEHWMKAVQDAGIYFGSRAIGAAPMGGSVTMLQANPNTAARESMNDIKEDMVSMGARLLTPNAVPKTAEQSRSETAAGHSVLSLVAMNVSHAYTDALTDAALYMRITEDVSFKINTDISGLAFDPQKLDSMVRAWQMGSIPNSDHWANLRTMGLIAHDKPDDEIEDEIAEDSGTGLILDDA